MIAARRNALLLSLALLATAAGLIDAVIGGEADFVVVFAVAGLLQAAQAFTVGRVRIILTDTRSERTATSMLGTRQRPWLDRELVTASRSRALVLWVNPDPWIAPANAASDGWAGYADERRRLVDVIAGADIRNLVMVGGDAHWRDEVLLTHRFTLAVPESAG